MATGRVTVRPLASSNDSAKLPKEITKADNAPATITRAGARQGHEEEGGEGPGAQAACLVLERRVGGLEGTRPPLRTTQGMVMRRWAATSGRSVPGGLDAGGVRKHGGARQHAEAEDETGEAQRGEENGEEGLASRKRAPRERERRRDAGDESRPRRDRSQQQAREEAGNEPWLVGEAGVPAKTGAGWRDLERRARTHRVDDHGDGRQEEHRVGDCRGGSQGDSRHD